MSGSAKSLAICSILLKCEHYLKTCRQLLALLIQHTWRTRASLKLLRLNDNFNVLEVVRKGKRQIGFRVSCANFSKERAILLR